METVNGINKDVYSVKLLQTTVLPYPVDCVCFCDLLKTQHCCLCPNGSYNPPLAALPPHHSLHPTHSLICATHDITVAVQQY